MHDKTIDLAEADLISIDTFVQDRRKLFLDQLGKLGAQYNAKSVFLDVPSHDPLCVAPEVLSHRRDARGARVCTPRTRMAQQRACSSVTEQGGRYEHRHAVVNG